MLSLNVANGLAISSDVKAGWLVLRLKGSRHDNDWLQEIMKQG